MNKQPQRLYPYKKNGRFYNHPHENPQGFFFKTLPTFIYSILTSKRRKPADIDHWVAQPSGIATQEDPMIIWIGHSSFLITINGITILTDPIFGDMTFLYRRMAPAGITLDNLPRIDFVIISHNHRDHMDAPSLMGLKAKFPDVTVLVPQGDKAWFDKRGFAKVNEYTWWDQEHFTVPQAASASIRFTFLPAIHWSQRGLFDKNRSLWGSWLIECNSSTIYFAGDTAYSSHFSMIAREVSAIDVALLPIGPCEPRAWLKHSHIGPDEAGQAFLDLDAHHFIPMHWGTFGFGIDPFDAPIIRLRNWWMRHQDTLETKNLHITKIGAQKLFTYYNQASMQELIKEPI